MCSSFTVSGENLSDEDTFSDTLEDVVTSVKRNGVAMKGTVDKIYYINDVLFTNSQQIITEF